MYSPSLTQEQIQQLFRLAKARRRPMTKVLRVIVDEYLQAHQEELQGFTVITISPKRRSA